MEYCSPGTLADQLERGGPMPETTVQKLAVQLIIGLNWIHFKAVVHRDIKVSFLLPY